MSMSQTGLAGRTATPAVTTELQAAVLARAGSLRSGVCHVCVRERERVCVCVSV
jgi:hypothetical protein